MHKIAILTDSSCDIPREQAEALGIDIMDFISTIDGKDYKAGVDTPLPAYYELLRTAKGLPSTAALTPMQFFERYKRYLDEGYTDVLNVQINQGASSTWDNSVLGEEMLAEERPGHALRIHRIDSRTYSMGLGSSLMQAAAKLQNGADLPTVIDFLTSQFDRQEICLAAFSLKQLKKSGRVNAAAAFAGDLLGLRPIIKLNWGKSSVEAKVRGNERVLPAMTAWVKSRYEGDVRDMHYEIGYTDCEEAMDDLVRLCRKEFKHEPARVFHLGGVVSCNTGPDAIAILFVNTVHKD